jgi:hypothetical protein
MRFHRMIPLMIAVAGFFFALGMAGGRGQEATDAPIVPPVPGAVNLFDGHDLSHWVRRGTQEPPQWIVEDGAMRPKGGDIATKENYDDYLLHLEWMEPDMPNARGQGKGNSGIALQGRYEIQILDSYGWKVPGTGDCGAVYSKVAPLINACKPARKWQSFDITYRAQRLGADGQIAEKPRVTVLQNGIVVQNNTEIPGMTGIQYNFDPDPTKPGPISLQDHGFPVKFRNVWVLPLPKESSKEYDSHN